MAKRYLLSFFVAVMLSFNAFSQTQIWTAQDFIDLVETSGDYKLMADINLGVFENSTIKSSFSGTFDGNGHTITYQASYNSGSFGLFQSVDGTIKNLTVSASVTFGGANNALNVGLLCGSLGSSGLLQSCNVIGVINSTAVSSNGSGTDSGLLVGESSGTIKYCIANGSVTGLGHVGGLIGRMNGGSVLGSAFTGSLYAIAPDKANQGGSPHSYGSIAGGICGAVQAGSSIKSCFVDADIVAEDANKHKVPCLPYGIAYDHKDVNIDVLNNYCEGTLNGEPIDAHADVTNSDDTGNYSNYYPGYNSMTNQQIVDALNTAKGNDPNINFGVAGGEVIFGVVSTTKVCETPTNLTITNNAGAFTASWTSADTNNTIEESHWHWSLTGGDAYDSIGDASSATLLATPISVDLGVLPASSTPYTFMVYTDCSETVNGLTSSAASSTFTVDCPAPTGLTANNITDNGFTISWNADVECQVSFNGNEEIILSNQEKTKSFEGLNPETQYTAIVKAKCGNEYVEQASINVTTARLAAPTGLTVTPIWQSTSGKIVVTWDMVDGLTYEIEGETGDKVSGFEKTELSVGAYTLKIRAKKGEKTSEWVSMPYTISNPEAPKNPEVTYDEQVGGFNVEIDWQQGVEGDVTWFVAENTADLDGTSISKPYILENKQAGETFSILIKEKSNNGQNVSQALVVPIQVPCLPASEPTSIVPALNSVTFNFDDAKTRKIFIGSTMYNVDATSFTIDGLTEGTSYAYEIREYCNTTTNTYSSISSTFSTLACNPVANLSFSNVGQTSATISWTSQSTNLQYKVVVNEEEPTVQTAKTINLTGLTPATTYTVRVSEQCGAVGNWGEERTITFTTQGAKTYISAKTGNFSDGATWIGGQIPSIGASETASITINAGHIVTLDVTFVLRNNITFTNNGVLSIGQTGELINTTGNNVGGIVEVVTPIKTMNQWTFIGAPFINEYTLGTILPVSGSDISISKYNYSNGEWNSTWEDVESTMKAGEGYFAWPFYGGVVTYTTYGDVCEWDANANNGKGAWVNNGYKPNQQPETALNNADFTITREIKLSPNGGYWMALSNPYPARLSVDSLLSQNSGIQGNCTYRLNGTTWEIKNATSGNIEITEGFFLNVVSAGEKTINFSKTQLTNYPKPTPQQKSQVAPIEYVELSLVKGNHKSKLYFAHNQEAEQNYDIFDANKMFSPVEVAEPYFVTEGIALVKEEVKELPYYATMNVRSYKDDTVSFVVKNIPKDMSVFIIDNEEEIKMSEDVAYTTHISEGENADRFQVLFKKASVIEEAKDSEITITNTNRLVRVESTQTDLRIEVYNALGQKVFATNDYNFTLNEVSAGTYMIKAYNRITTQTAKIVVE